METAPITQLLKIMFSNCKNVIIVIYSNNISQENIYKSHFTYRCSIENNSVLLKLLIKELIHFNMGLSSSEHDKHFKPLSV